MDITLSKDFKTLKIDSPKIRPILEAGDYQCIRVSVKSCICPDACTNDCVDITGEEEIAVAKIPKVSQVFIEKINFEYQFTGRYVNVLKTPIYYDADHDVLLTALTNQITSSLEQLGFSNAADTIITYEDTGEFFELRIKNLPKALLPKSVIYDYVGIKKEEYFTHSSDLIAFATDNFIFISSKIICQEQFQNDILTINIEVITHDNMCISFNECYFTDVDIKCRVAECLPKLAEGKIETHLLYFGLKEASCCLDDCGKMCELLNRLLETLNNECTDC